MCSFGSCQTRFELLSQFRKFRNAFECFITQVQTRLQKTKCVWPMKINVICTVRESWPRRGRARAPAPSLLLHRQNLQEAAGVTSQRREVQGHGGLRAPGSRLPPRGTRVAPQIFTEPRNEHFSSDRQTCHGPLRTF